MKNKLHQFLLAALFLTTISFSANAQAVLWSENFNSGSSSQMTLNTTDASSTGATSMNLFYINDSYDSLTVSVDQRLVCAPFAGFPVPIPGDLVSDTTAWQPSGIAGSPKSNYLHIVAKEAESAGLKNAYYIVSTGLCFGPESNFVKMNSDINTTNYSNVKLNFWWMLGGLSSTIYGEVYYSIDGGSSWTQVATNLTDQQTWAQASYSDPAFDGQAQLRFGFRWVCDNVTGTPPDPTDPSFSIDDITVTGCPPCDVNSIPQNPSIGAVKSTTAVVRWDVQPCVWRYRVAYREVGTTHWTVKVAGHNSGHYTIKGLDPATTYEWEVRTSCFQSPFTKSKPSARLSFTTKNGGVRMEEKNSVINGGLIVYPNPNKGDFTLGINSNSSEKVVIKVTNILGQEIFSKNLDLVEGMNSLNIELTNKAAGIYSVILRTSKTTIAEKIFVE